jgi:hypothetical protein
MRADLRGCGFDLVAEKVQRQCTDDLVCKQRGNFYWVFRGSCTRRARLGSLVCFMKAIPEGFYMKGVLNINN